MRQEIEKEARAVYKQEMNVSADLAARCFDHGVSMPPAAHSALERTQHAQMLIPDHAFDDPDDLARSVNSSAHNCRPIPVPVSTQTI